MPDLALITDLGTPQAYSALISGFQLAWGVKFEDFDLDGLPDLALIVTAPNPTGLPESFLRVYPGAATPLPISVEPLVYPTGSYALFLSVGQVDADEAPDILVSNSGPGPSAGRALFIPWLNRGAPSLTVSTLVDEDDGNAMPSNGTGTSLREGLAYAQSLGGARTIRFAPGLLNGGATFSLNSALSVGSGADITIDGAGPGGVTLSGRGQNGVLQVSSGKLTLRNMTIADGFIGGGGIGAGVAATNGATLVVEGCTFRNNYTEGRGGAIATAGASAVTIRNSTLTGNTGIGILSTTAGAVMENSTIAGNAARNNIGGWHVFGGSATLNNNIIANNSGNDIKIDAGSIAGARNLIRSGDLGALTGTINADPLLGALADHGGPTQTMALLPGSPAFNAATTLASITTDQRGIARPQHRAPDLGAYEDDGALSESLIVTTLAEENNLTSDPAYGTGTSLREAMEFAENNPGPDTITFAPGLSGAINLTEVGGFSSGNVAFEIHSQITIVGPASGSGVTIQRAAGAPEMRLFHTWQNQGDLTLRNLTLADGRASTFFGASYGGALSNAHKLTLENCTIRSSVAAFGGAIYQSGGDLTLRNCTLAGNNASYGGSAIYFNDFNGTVELMHLTVSGNSVTGGTPRGAFFSQGTSTSKTVRNCVVSGNPGGDVLDVPFAAGSSNNLIGGNAMLNGLASNGGTTPTMLPQPGSPLVNAGTPAALTTDQRGVARPQGSAPEIGAVEVRTAPPVAFANISLNREQSDPAFDLTAATGATPTGGVWSGTGISNGQFNPSAASLGTNVVTYTVTTANADPGFNMNSGTVSIFVGQRATFTSATSATFTVGAAGSFTVGASGFPAPTLSVTGTLPGGLSFNPSNGQLSGTPNAGTGGTYPLNFTASNGVGSNATQSFILTVNQAPAITSGDAATFVVASAGNFAMGASGFPAPSFSTNSALPNGVSLYAAPAF